MVYVQNINEITRAAAHNISMFDKAVDEANASSVVILTTQWDLIDKKTGEERFEQLKSEPGYFKNAVEHGATITRSQKEDDYEELLQAIVKSHENRGQMECEIIRFPSSIVDKFILYVLWYSIGL